MNFSPKKRVNSVTMSRVARSFHYRRMPLDIGQQILGFATSQPIARRHHSSAERVMVPSCFLKIKLKEYQAS